MCLSVRPSVVHPSHNPSICPSIFCFGMITRVNINRFSVKIWFGIAYGQILQNFDSYLPETCTYFCFRTITCKCQGIITKLGKCIDIKEIRFGNAYGQISSVFDRVTCLRHDNGGVL